MTHPVKLSAEDRRAQLIQVAVDLFSRKGFKGTTTREIATAAGVTEAIIFRHFKTKEQLYTAIIDQRLKSPEAAVWMAAFQQAMDQNDDEAVVRELIDAIISTHREEPKFERLMLYAALEGNEIALLHMQQLTELIVEAFRSYMLRRKEYGAFCTVNPDLALAAIAGMAQHFALRKYIHGLKEQCASDAEAVEGFTRIALDGLGIRKTKNENVVSMDGAGFGAELVRRQEGERNGGSGCGQDGGREHGESHSSAGSGGVC